METINLICTVYNHSTETINSMLNSARHCLQYCPYFSYQFILVNNGLNELTDIDDCDDILFLEPKTNLGYCDGNNLGMRLVQRDYIIIVNPDVIFNNSLCFDWLISTAKRYDCITGDLIGTPQWYTYPASLPTDKIYEIDELPFYFDEPTHDKPGNWKPLKYINGCLFAFKTQLWKDRKIIFDPNIFPGYFGETAMCFNAYLQNVELKDCAVKNWYTHNSIHNDEEKQKIKEWTKIARDYFYINYITKNWNAFLKFTGVNK